MPREVETSEVMKPFTLKPPALGHATSCEACSTRNGNPGAGEVKYSKDISTESCHDRVRPARHVGALHLGSSAARCRDFKTSTEAEDSAQCEPIENETDEGDSAGTDSAGRSEMNQNYRHFR